VPNAPFSFLTVALVTLGFLALDYILRSRNSLTSGRSFIRTTSDFCTLEHSHCFPHCSLNFKFCSPLSLYTTTPHRISSRFTSPLIPFLFITPCLLGEHILTMYISSSLPRYFVFSPICSSYRLRHPTHALIPNYDLYTSNAVESEITVTTIHATRCYYCLHEGDKKEKCSGNDHCPAPFFYAVLFPNDLSFEFRRSKD